MKDSRHRKLVEALGSHRLIWKPGTRDSDQDLENAHVAFGQPSVDGLLRNQKLRFVQISSAGYTTYDRADLRQHLRALGAQISKSSLVYDEPCAEHALALIMSWARQLPAAHDTQRGARGWPTAEIRARCLRLCDQTAVLVGYGSIAKRLTSLLAPLRMALLGIRRKVRGDEAVPTVAFDDARASEFLGRADHVIDLLPDGASTRVFFDRTRFARLKPGAVFYNIGRGTTVDQTALLECLTSGQLAAALLDVTDPEPLPPAHPLWTAPNCFITPHAAGGHSNEEDRLVEHFLANLTRVEHGEPPADLI